MLLEGENLDDVTHFYMSDEEQAIDEKGFKIFVRHAPKWRSNDLTKTLRQLDERYQHTEAGSTCSERRYGIWGDRPVPKGAPRKFVKFTN